MLAANALALTGDCYVNLKQYDKALDYFRKAVSKADKNPQIVPRVLLKEANVYDEQKKYDKARMLRTDQRNEHPQFQVGSGLGIDAYIAREKRSPRQVSNPHYEFFHKIIKHLLIFMKRGLDFRVTTLSLIQQWTGLYTLFPTDCA